jgi:hypothetical protein
VEQSSLQLYSALDASAFRRKEDTLLPTGQCLVAQHCKGRKIFLRELYYMRESKSRTQHPSSLLKPLSVPERPWQSVGIDFVGPLPESRNRHGGFNMICTIIDHLTSMVHLVPIRREYKAREVAELVFDVIYKAHGLPEIIVSDHDSLFTSTFWSRLHSLIGTELRISSSWHPQTDSATEQANRTLYGCPLL